LDARVGEKLSGRPRLSRREEVAGGEEGPEGGVAGEAPDGGEAQGFIERARGALALGRGDAGIGEGGVVPEVLR
jgi:hypothetical protein